MLSRALMLALVTAVLAPAVPAVAADSLQAGGTTLVGRPDGFGPLPAQSDGHAFVGKHGISSDGRFTVFASDANDLAGASDVSHVFVRDDQTGAVTLLDRAGPGGAVGDSWGFAPSISADGSRACFTSAATNLVAGVGEHHVYVVTIATGAIAAADRATGGALGDGQADHCALDADGNTIAFESQAKNLAPGVSYGTHVYARHLDSATTQIVDAYQGTVGTNDARQPVIDSSGSTVAFASSSTNLNGPGGDTNAHTDVYVRALGASQPVLVSRANGAGGAIGDGSSDDPSISADGSLIAFASTAANFGDGDADSTTDIHLRNLTTGTTTLVSRADGAGAKGNDSSEEPTIAGDGSAVAFLSRATNLGADPGANDEGSNQMLFLRAIGSAHTAVLGRESGAAGAVSQGSYGQPSLDQHAANVVFDSQNGDFDPLADGSFSEVFQRHLAGAFETRLLSRPADASGRPAGIAYTDDTNRAISADGRFVVFTAVGQFGGPAGLQEVYVRDALLGTTRLVSRADGPDGAPADRSSGRAAISADGTKVGFESYAGNLAGAAGRRGQVYVRDLVAGTTTLVSTGASGAASGGARDASLSQDGTRVAFVSASTDLVAGDGNGAPDIFVRDLVAGTTVRASLTAGGGEADDQSSDAMISADGTRVGFTSSATNIDPAASTKEHVYVRDLAAGTTTLVDRAPDGTPADGYADRVAMSADGNRFLFSVAGKLIPEAATNGDAYVRDVAAGTTILAGVGPGGEHSSKQVFPMSISLDGSKVAFETQPGAFGAGDPATGWVRDINAGTTVPFALRDGTQAMADSNIEGASLDADGNCVVFASRDSTLASVSFAGRDVDQLWLHTLAGECPVHAPDTTITSGPGARKVRTAVTAFAYQADESGATFVCSIDAAAAVPCGATFTTRPLRDGVHRFTVAAKDRAGNVDPTPALATFTVGVPPRVTKLRLSHGRLVFRLSEKATVRVRLARVGHAHSAAVGKLTVKRVLKAGTRRIKLPLRRLRAGHYHATVVATDRGGNRSATKRKSFDVRPK